MIKDNNGITLVALVITIITMLILAGVTINFTMNDNIIFQANDAKFRTEVAAIQEKWNMEKAVKEMKDIPYSEMNYELKDALKNVYDVSDSFNKKLKIEKGNIVFNPSECSKNEIKSLESLQIYAMVE